jgi:hypothetical protein
VADQAAAGAALIDIDRDPLAQFDIRQRAAVGTVGGFGVRAAVGIIVKRFRYTFFASRRKSSTQVMTGIQGSVRVTVLHCRTCGRFRQTLLFQCITAR